MGGVTIGTIVPSGCSNSYDQVSRARFGGSSSVPMPINHGVVLSASTAGGGGAAGSVGDTRDRSERLRARQ